MATRTTLDDYRGGRVMPEDDEPKRLRYPCFAGGCPMPGTIWPTQLDDKSTKPGSCAWHHGVNPSDIPKVTRVLQDWQCLAYEANEARRAMCGEIASDPKALADAFATAWERLKPLVTGWEAQLQPGNIRTSKGVDTGHPQSYRDWGMHLERFLGARVVEVLDVHHQRRAAA